MRRAAYLVFILLFPAVVLVAFALRLAFPEVPEMVFFGGAFLFLAAIWTAVAFAGRNRREGFAGELEILAANLREHAAKMENQKVEVSTALQEFLAELRIKARTFDHHEIVVGFDVAVPDANEFREAAAELDEYAADVRSRDGIRWR